MNFFVGVNFFFQGIALANKPGLRRYFWLPVGIGLFLTSVTLYFFGSSIIAAATPDLPDWLSWLAWIIVPVLFVLLALVSAWSVSFITIIIASPLFSDLASAVERQAQDTTPSALSELDNSAANNKSVMSLLNGIWKDLGRELRKLRYHLPRLLGLLILSFIPVVNLIAPLLGGLYGAWIMSVQFSDYAADNHNMSFTDSLAQLNQNLLPSMGFGAMTSLAMAIPLLNFFLLPAAVAGGTLLWRHNQTNKTE
jgi:CysZ protein